MHTSTLASVGVAVNWDELEALLPDIALPALELR